MLVRWREPNYDNLPDFQYAYDHHWDSFMAWPKEHISQQIRWAVIRESDGVPLAYTVTKRKAVQLSAMLEARYEPCRLEAHRGRVARFRLNERF
jgi:hypothetical protein